MPSKLNSPIGFGTTTSTLNFYIANRPPITPFSELNTLYVLQKEDIGYIAKNTSNHWRKVFNVCAKFLFELEHDTHQQSPWATWQAFRDESMFQTGSPYGLHFSTPNLSAPNLSTPKEEQNKVIHIVCGKTYAQTLELPHLLWLDNYFAISETHPIIVCPYLDYRQLSNARISQLVALTKNMQAKSLK